MDQENTFAVIFDMDGVLIDSTKYIWESFNTLVEPFGVHFDEIAIKKYLGHSLRDQISMWKEEYGIDVGDANVFSVKASAIQKELLGNVTKPNEDLLQLLQSLKERNVPMGVGTSSNRSRAKSMLLIAEIDHYFSALVTAEDIFEHKPNPHIFLEVARLLNTLPESCVVIEDAATGIEAAKRGNMKSIGFLTEWNSKDELHTADKTIGNFQELSFEELEKMFYAKKRAT